MANWDMHWGTKILNPKTIGRISGPSFDKPSERFGSYAGMRITIDPNLPPDGMIIKSGEAFVSHEKYAELQRKVQNEINDQIYGKAIAGVWVDELVEPKIDHRAIAEQEEMESLEMWGAF